MADKDDRGVPTDADGSDMDLAARKEWLLRDEVRSELLSIARSLGLRDDAEDVYHEFCLDKLDAIARAYDPKRRDLALAAKAFRNYCLTRLAARTRERKKVPTEDLTAASELCSDFPSSLKALEESEVRQAVEQALRRLNAASQEILNFFYWDGRSCEEIGFLIGKSRTAVKVALHRARNDMKAILHDEVNALSPTDITDWPWLAAQMAGLSTSPSRLQCLWNLLPDRVRALARIEATSSAPNVDRRRDLLAGLNGLLRRQDLWQEPNLHPLAGSSFSDSIRMLSRSQELTISVNRQILETVIGPVIRARVNAVRKI